MMTRPRSSLHEAVRVRVCDVGEDWCLFYCEVDGETNIVGICRLCIDDAHKHSPPSVIEHAKDAFISGTET